MSHIIPITTDRSPALISLLHIIALQAAYICIAGGVRLSRSWAFFSLCSLCQFSPTPNMNLSRKASPVARRQKTFYVKLAIRRIHETAPAIRKNQKSETELNEILEEKTLDLEINIANLTKIYLSTFIEATAANQFSAAKGCLDSLAKLYGLAGEKDAPLAGSGFSGDERRSTHRRSQRIRKPA